MTCGGQAAATEKSCGTVVAGVADREVAHNAFWVSMKAGGADRVLKGFTEWPDAISEAR